ncbi:MAG: SulP family inorganic anion transporter [Bacteroidetes bacterium]|nr:SulP family inorganic anion transporter [Bacteroidota bacterium]
MNSKFHYADIRSGLVVFLVALPLCLGIALACNVPLFSGILAGVIGGVVVALFSGSQMSVSGPAAGLTSIVVSSVAILGSYEAFIAAVLLAGILQIVLGIIKAGSIANYIPSAVIKGMLAGIGIILILKQMPHLVGYDKDPEGDFYFDQPDGHNSFSDLVYMLNYITPGAAITGLISVLILLLADRPFYKRNRILSMFPGPLLAVLAGIGLNVFFSSSAFWKIAPEHLVVFPRIGNWYDFKTILLSPDFSMWNHASFWIIVVTIALVASIESLLSVEATDKLDPEKRKTDTNRELMAQGVGNILCGLSGALPVTAVVVRSSANIQAGAKTKISAVIHALLLAGCVLMVPGILMLIPNATLAAILILTGYKLTKLSLFKEQYRRGLDQFLPFVVTIVVMLLTDLLKGVSAGLIVAVIFIIRANIRNSFDIANDFIDGRVHYIIRLPQHITFFNKGFMIRYFNSIRPGSKVIIDGTVNKTTDKDAREILEEFVNSKDEKYLDIEIVKYNL